MEVTGVGATRILVVDDEPAIRQVVRAYLEREGFTVVTASSGPQALEAFQAQRPDVVILDIMLPGLDGLEVLTRLRQRSDVYVIMLTAKTEEMDRVVGLTLGADDYVPKPFSPHELVARVKAGLRRLRRGAEQAPRLRFGGLELDAAARRVWMDGREVHLTPREFDLLLALAEHRGWVMTRQQLLDRVWGAYYGDARVVDVHIGNVRKKLGPYGRWIVTVRGVGYRFDGEEERDA